MMYEEALKVWASKKYDLDLNAIRKVSLEFEKGYGGGCDTCGYGADDGSIEISISLDGGGRYFEENVSEFGKLLQEIVEAGQEVARPVA